MMFGELRAIGGVFKYFFMFIPNIGEMIQFDSLAYFFRWVGWFNHQPEEVFAEIFGDRLGNSDTLS